VDGRRTAARRPHGRVQPPAGEIGVVVPADIDLHVEVFEDFAQHLAQHQGRSHGPQLVAVAAGAVGGVIHHFASGQLGRRAAAVQVQALAHPQHNL